MNIRAAIALVLLAACRPAPRASIPVVLISIDTLRSDHLPAYGYGGVATPAIDRLRSDGILFERAYSHVPLTLPSHVSMLTGVLPSRSGVRDNVGYELAPGRLPYLPEILRAAGYATGGAVSSFVLRRETGLATGFDLYDAKIESRVGRGLGALQRAGVETLRPLLGWLGEVRGEKFFLFLHVYEPHAPYTPPAPFDTRYRSAYDGEIAAADAAIGELLGELEARGLYRQALIVLTSDHGEGLGDHGENGHGALLYRHDLQVPLLVKLPQGRRAGESVSRPVGLIDIAPTVLAVLDLPVPPEMTGESLLDQVTEERALYGETWLPRLHYGWSELSSLVDARFHFIDGPDPELYDLVADPAETRNLIAAERRVRVSMAKALARLRTPLEPPGPADEETRRSLAALGYLGTAAVGEGEALPDPKAMLATLVTLEQGLELFAQKNPEGALPLLRRATKENPRMVDAWDYLGRSYQRLGRQAEALEAFGRAMALSGGQPELALDLARALVEAGRPEEAAAVLIDQARKTPQDLRLAYLAVRVELLLGRVDAARARAEDLVRRAPQDADASYALGSVAMASRELELAERALRRALELQPQHPAALSDLGVLLAAQKRRAEARLLFERLARLQPDNESARRGLSELAVQ